MDKKLLVVTYYFPPGGGGGVQRILKFVKYLPHYGWKPVILTTTPDRYATVDPTLQNEITSDAPIISAIDKGLPVWLPWRARNFFSKWFLFSDPQRRWRENAINEGIRSIKDHKINAILSTAPPYIAHLVGLELSARTGLPWIADYRDLWTGNNAIFFATQWHRKQTETLERNVLQGSNLLTVVSQPMKERIQANFQPVTDKIRVITNGYDPADFSDHAFQPKSTDKFRLVYSGTLYGQQRSLKNLLVGIQHAINSGRIPETKFQLVLVGSVSRDLMSEIEKSGLENIVDYQGYLTHKESIIQIMSADALLLVIGDIPGSEGIYTGKIFEYLAVRKPILALAPPGVAADLIKEAAAGVVAHPTDLQSIANRLGELFDAWSNGEKWVGFNEAVINRYNRENLTAQLAGYLDEITLGS